MRDAELYIDNPIFIASDNYSRIAAIIEFIQRNFKKQPSLDAIAHEVGLSPVHLQRVFTEWAGVSPKKFMEYLSVEYAKKVLQDGQATLFDAVTNSSAFARNGFSIEGMAGVAAYSQGRAHYLWWYCQVC